jgi:hypothetical protein
MNRAPDLETVTKEFFRLYWNEGQIGEPRPQWSNWNLIGRPPEADKAGCYAICRGSKVLYIGVAVTAGKNHKKTGKRYGLLDRLLRHVISRKGRGSSEYIPKAKKEQWKSITCICLIGFPDGHRHLAAALEAYLIERIPTVVNAEARWREGAQ